MNAGRGAALVHLPLRLRKHLRKRWPDLFAFRVDYFAAYEHEESGSKTDGMPVRAAVIGLQGGVSVNTDDNFS